MPVINKDPHTIRFEEMQSEIKVRALTTSLCVQCCQFRCVEHKRILLTTVAVADAGSARGVVQTAQHSVYCCHWHDGLQECGSWPRRNQQTRRETLQVSALIVVLKFSIRCVKVVYGLWLLYNCCFYLRQVANRVLTLQKDCGAGVQSTTSHCWKRHSVTESVSKTTRLAGTDGRGLFVCVCLRITTEVSAQLPLLIELHDYIKISSKWNWCCFSLADKESHAFVTCHWRVWQSKDQTARRGAGAGLQWFLYSLNSVYVTQTSWIR